MDVCKRTVVVLPGLNGTANLLRAFVACAPPGVAARILDYPRDCCLGYEELLTHVQRRLPAGDLDVVAESFAGPLAVALADAFPSRVSSITFVASFVCTPAPWIAHGLPWSAVFRLPLPTWALKRFLVGTDADQHLLNQVRASVRRVQPGVMAHRVRSLLRVDARDGLRRTRCPVLYLQAIKDGLIPPRCVREILACRPDTVVREVGNNHMILQRHPAEAWRMITDHSPSWTTA